MVEKKGEDVDEYARMGVLCARNESHVYVCVREQIEAIRVEERPLGLRMVIENLLKPHKSEWPGLKMKVKQELEAHET